MKATAVAPSNIAFIKYWGKKDEKLRLPENGSISMNLSNLYTTTTVDFDKKYKNDFVIIDGSSKKEEVERVSKHLDRVRSLAGIKLNAKVVSNNNFGIGRGSSSSASGFAALTVAAAKASGLNLSEKQLSILARQGSGSACRSIPDGFVEWLDGDTNESSFAVSIYPPTYWDIADVVVVVKSDRKDISSTEGQKLTKTSPFFTTRLKFIKDKINLIKKYLREKNFVSFGELVESEALELHAIMLTSTPSLIFWFPGTVQVMRLVKQLRKEGLPVFFTVNTGQDVHLIIEKKNIDILKTKLNVLDDIENIIVNFPAIGTNLSKDHLF